MIYEVFPKSELFFLLFCFFKSLLFFLSLKKHFRTNKFFYVQYIIMMLWVEFHVSHSPGFSEVSSLFVRNLSAIAWMIFIHRVVKASNVSYKQESISNIGGILIWVLFVFFHQILSFVEAWLISWIKNNNPPYWMQS